jgi:hypothetical protein
MTRKRPSNTGLNSQPDKAAIGTAIDTVEFDLRGVRFNSNNKFIRHSQLRDADGNLLKESSSLFRVQGYNGGNKAVLRSVKLSLAGDVLTPVSLSVPKFFSGQNVCGTADLKPQVGEVIAQLFQKLRPHHDKGAHRTMASVRPKHVRLRRVDIFRCYRLSHPDQVTGILNRLGIYFATRKRGQHFRFASRYLWWQAKGRRGIKIVFYDKTQEVERNIASRNRGGNVGVNLPQGVLRIELRLFSEELERLGLAKLSRWRKNTAVRLFDKYVGEIVNASSLVVPSSPLCRRTLDELPYRLRPPYALASLGVNLMHVYSEPSLRRYGKLFPEHGIDIRARGKPRVQSVAKVLKRARVITAAMLPKARGRCFKYPTLRKARGLPVTPSD